MKRTMFALAAAALLTITAGCGDSDGGSGRLTKAEVSRSIQENAGFPKAQADCVAGKLMSLPAAALKAIVENKTQGSVSETERKASEAAITKAVTECAEATPGTTASTTVPG